MFVLAVNFGDIICVFLSLLSTFYFDDYLRSMFSWEVNELSKPFSIYTSGIPHKSSP